MKKPAAKRVNKSPVRKAIVAKGLGPAAGWQAVINKALKQFGGGYRGATYNPKTGQGTAT